MASLPTVGGSAGVWGSELSTWLLTGHNSDGTNIPGPQLTPTTVKTSAYTVQNAQAVPVDASGGTVNITVPSAPADNFAFAVKMVKVSGSNVVNINLSGTDKFNAGTSTTFTLRVLDHAIVAQYSASAGVFYIWGDDVPLSQLDARYSRVSNNLSDLASPATARDNLGAFGVVNAKTDFGAVGNASTDDTTALQNFFTAIATGGSKAGFKGYIPPGTYKVTSAIVGGNHTQCVGGGKYNTTIKQWTPNQDVLKFVGSSGANMLGVELSDFSLTGPYHVDSAGTATHSSTTVDDTHAVASDVGLSISGSGIPGGATIVSVTPGAGYVISAAATTSLTNPTLTIGGTSTGVGLNLNWWLDTCSAKRMIIQGNGSHGVLQQNSYLFSFEHIWHYNNGGDGLHAVTSINSAKYDNCEFFGNALNGASVDGAAGLTFTACDFETNGQHGLKFPHVYSGLVNSCDFENNGTSSPGTTYSAIYVDATSGYAGISILGCNFTGTSATTANGIEFTGNCTASYIEGCSFNNFALNDILIDSGASGVVIGKNIVHQAGAGAFITDNSGVGKTTYIGVHPDAVMVSSDMGLASMNFDPDIAPGTSAPTYSNYTAGVVFLAKLNIRKPVKVSKIAIYWSQPTGGSPANCFLALVNSSGTQVDVTGDLTLTATGLITPSLGGSHNLAAGVYYVALLIGTQGSTAGGAWYPANTPRGNFSVFTGAHGALAISASSFRWAHQLTAQTSIPSPLTLSSNADGSTTPGFWCGVL